MEKKVFVLGLPGSGKSTAARYVEVLAQVNGWSSTRFNDYDILYEMFEADDGKRFSCTDHNGFDVHDHRAFDDALIEVERRVLQRERITDKDELIIIEFARNDYGKALRLFHPEFLCNASFLFVDADIPACKQRIRERVLHPSTRDDHFVSEYIFEAYYEMDNRQYLDSTASSLKECCGINRDRRWVIDNTHITPMTSFLEDIKAFASSIFDTRIYSPELASAIEQVTPSYLNCSEECQQASELPLEVG